MDLQNQIDKKKKEIEEKQKKEQKHLKKVTTARSPQLHRQRSLFQPVLGPRVAVPQPEKKPERIRVNGEGSRGPTSSECGRRDSTGRPAAAIRAKETLDSGLTTEQREHLSRTDRRQAPNKKLSETKDQDWQSSVSIGEMMRTVNDVSQKLPHGGSQYILNMQRRSPRHGHIRNQTQESVPLTQRTFHRQASSVSHRHPQNKGTALFNLMDKIMLLDKLDLAQEENGDADSREGRHDDLGDR